MKSKVTRIVHALKGLALLFFVLTTLFHAKADVLVVPDDYSSIQAAIDAALEGDTVMIHPGRYYENVEIMGKGITLTSYYEVFGDYTIRDRTIIDATNSGRCLTILQVVTETVVKGLILTNGYTDYGAGISIGSGSNVVLEDLLVINNHTNNNTWAGGGGIGIGGGSTMILRNSEIRDNSCFDYGGGINIRVDINALLENVLIQNNTCRNYSGHGKGGGLHIDYGSEVEIRNCEITRNHTNIWGGGLAIGWDAQVDILNTTIADNSALAGGGAIYFNWGGIDVSLGNVIAYNNSPQEIYFDDVCYGDTLSIFHSDIQGGQEAVYNITNSVIDWLDGNIRENPVFYNPSAKDYSLHETSPCIDYGTALYVINGDTLINLQPDDYIGIAPDMGCHEYDPFVGLVNSPGNVEGNLSLYPNPVKDILHFDLKDIDLPICIEIFATDGKLIYNQVLHTLTHKLDVSSLENGVYYLRIQRPDKAISRKLIVTK